MVNNKPHQLDDMRNEFYDKQYARQPVLGKRLMPLLNKANTIQNFDNVDLEPTLSSPQDPLSARLSKSEPSADAKLKLRQDLNKAAQARSNIDMSVSRLKKVSAVRPDILYGLK